MALRLDSRYPGRFNPGDSSYPQGSFKNRTAPGALDGSYLEKDWANDKEGFFQRLMIEAGITPNGTVDTALASQYYDALQAVILSTFDPTAFTPAGSVVLLARNTAPTGWLKANGAAVSRATYSDLFAVIGTTYGPGNGSTTFNLPDLRGEFLRGWDDGRGIDAGRAFGSLQDQSTQSHTHTGNTTQSFLHAGAGGIGGPASAGITGIGATLGGLSGVTRPRNVALLACIKY